MTDNFIIIKNLKELDKSLEIVIDNFPKKEKVLKEEILVIIEEVYKQIYVFVYKYDNDICLEVISKIKYLNYLFDTMYQKKIISSKKYLCLGNLLISITKLLRGYYNEKSK